MKKVVLRSNRKQDEQFQGDQKFIKSRKLASESRRREINLGRYRNLSLKDMEESLDFEEDYE